MREGEGGGGGDCLKYLKRGWSRTEGRKNKDFKKGGQAESRGGCLKKGGGGARAPLRTMNHRAGKRFAPTNPSTIFPSISYDDVSISTSLQVFFQKGKNEARKKGKI